MPHTSRRAVIGRTARLAALALLAAGLAPSCGRLRAIPTACATDTDCNPGNVCVGGICGAPIDAGLGAGPGAGGAGGSGAGAGGAGAGGADADLSTDARDTGSPPSTDPCDATDIAATQPSRAALAGLLVGSWRVCPSSGSSSGFSFVVGSGRVQLKPTTWVPLVDTGNGWAPKPGFPEGIYYFLLEAPVNALHVASRIDGVDVAVAVSAAADAIVLTECDGAIRCTGPSTRLVAMQPAGPATSDAGQGASNASSP
jgi:hypothetical protein